MKEKILINAHIIDPSQGIDEKGSIIIDDKGKIKAIGKGVKTIDAPSAQVIDVNNHIVIPGIVDMKAFVGEPGYEYKENFRTLSQEALAGGVTSVVTMPNTKPILDNVSMIDFIIRRGRDKASINLFPCASLTREIGGKEMSEFGLLSAKGIIGFTDVIKTVQNTEIMARIIDYASDVNKSYTSVHKNWGKTDNDVQHINFAAPTASDGTYNTYDIERRFIFHAVGDSEYYSASMGKESDFTDASRFYNRLMIDTDFHANVSYESFIGVTNTNQTGRMLGKTRYFSTSSDGVITLPRNHVTKFSNPFKDRMYQGTQNPPSGSDGPGILNVQHEDVSPEAFYRVKVTGGDRQIIVKESKSPTLGSDGVVSY